MENDYEKLTVNKVEGGILFFLFGLFQVGVGLLIVFILIKNVINGDVFSQNIWLNLLLLFVSIFTIPTGLFALIYAFGDRRIFEIASTGITIKDKPTICWESIYQIETNKYPGPRMSFYRIKIIQDFDKKQKTNIWFSSDTDPEWTKITDVLSFHTTRHNIIST